MILLMHLLFHLQGLSSILQRFLQVTHDRGFPTIVLVLIKLNMHVRLLVYIIIFVVIKDRDIDAFLGRIGLLMVMLMLMLIDVKKSDCAILARSCPIISRWFEEEIFVSLGCTARRATSCTYCVP